VSAVKSPSVPARQPATAFPDPQIDVAVRQHGTTIVAEVHGEVDLASCEVLQRHLSAAFSKAPESIVVDLAAVEFMDSTAIHVLFNAAARAREHDVRLVVVRPTGAAGTVLDLCQLSQLVPVVESEGAPR
jgi:anti-sigma B factor antagonist